MYSSHVVAAQLCATAVNTACARLLGTIRVVGPRKSTGARAMGISFHTPPRICSHGGVGIPVWLGLSTASPLLSSGELRAVSFRAHILVLAAAHVAVPMAAAQLLSWRTLRHSWLFVLLSIWAACLPALAVSYTSSDFPTIAGGAFAIPAIIALARFRIGLPAHPAWPRPRLQPRLLQPHKALSTTSGSVSGGGASPATATAHIRSVASSAPTADGGSTPTADGGSGPDSSGGSGRSTASQSTPADPRIPSVHSGTHSMHSMHSVRVASWSRFSSMSGLSPPPGRNSFAHSTLSETDEQGPAAVSCNNEPPPAVPDRSGSPLPPPAPAADETGLVRSYSASHIVTLDSPSASTFASRRTRRSGVPQHTPAEASIMTSHSSTTFGGSTVSDAAANPLVQQVFASLAQAGAAHSSSPASPSMPLAIPRTKAAAAMMRGTVPQSWESGDGLGGSSPGGPGGGSPLERSMSPPSAGMLVPGAGGGGRSGGMGCPMRWPGALNTLSGGRSFRVSEPLTPHKEEEDEELMKLQDAMSEFDLDPGSEAGSLSVTSRAARAVTEGREPSGCGCSGQSRRHQLRWRCDVGGAGCPCEGCEQPGCAGPVAEAIEEWEEGGSSGHTGACRQPCPSWLLPYMHCLLHSMRVSGSSCQTCLMLLNPDTPRQHWSAPSDRASPACRAEGVAEHQGPPHPLSTSPHPLHGPHKRLWPQLRRR